MQYDPNSLLYISKAMDMFDMTGDDPLSAGGGTIQDVSCPTLVIGVQSDILFPIQQQREIVDLLRGHGNQDVTSYELNALYGHDTFLIDVNAITCALRGHL